MLEYVPVFRISAKEALNHQWFITSVNTDRDLNNVRSSFSAKATFKKAVNVVQGVNRLRRESDATSGRTRNQEEEAFIGGSPTSQSTKGGIAGIADMIAD